MSICILLLLIPITQGKYTCEISLSLDSILYYMYTGVQFSLIPSRPITIHQTAVYKCLVDINGVGILWNVNGNSSIDSSITNLGIMTYDAATQNSSLTIPGNSELNNTIVECIAFELDGFTLNIVNTTNATLLIQGMVYDYNYMFY